MIFNLYIQVNESDTGSYRISSDLINRQNPIGFRVMDLQSDPTDLLFWGQIVPGDITRDVPKACVGFRQIVTAGSDSIQS